MECRGSRHVDVYLPTDSFKDQDMTLAQALGNRLKKNCKHYQKTTGSLSLKERLATQPQPAGLVPTPAEAPVAATLLAATLQQPVDVPTPPVEPGVARTQAAATPMRRAARLPPVMAEQPQEAASLKKPTA